jgi:tetratricopeptide (TPR) repeat protein
MSRQYAIVSQSLFYQQCPLMSADPSLTAGELSTKQDWPPLLPAVRRRLQQCYEHAKKLMAQPKYDHDYAYTLFVECLLADPGNVLYVDAFLDNLARKYNQNKFGARLQFFVNRGPFKKGLQTKDWPAVLKAGWELLKINPWDVATLRGMAQACEQYHLNEAALQLLRMGLKGSPKDVELNRHAAQALGRMGQYDQAMALWAKVAEYAHGDEEADRMVSQLQMEKTRAVTEFADKTRHRPPTAANASTHHTASADGEQSRGGEKDQHENFQPISQNLAPIIPRNAPVGSHVKVNYNAAETPAVPKEKRREVQLTPAQTLERAIVEDPASLINYLQLAELYVAEGRPANAERVLSKALAVSGNDAKIQERLEEVQILRARQQLAIAQKQQATDTSEDAADLVAQLSDALNRLELEIYGRRAERYPAETHWQYELAVRLKKAGNYSEAAKYFVAIQEPVELAVAAILEAGESYQQLRQYPKAYQAYRTAIEWAEKAEKTDHLKLALYRTAVLGVALKDRFGEEMLRKLVKIDPNYRDARQRLDKIEQIVHNT